MENTREIGEVEGGERRGGDVAVANGEVFDAGGAERGENVN
jgi:hypothetical protein